MGAAHAQEIPYKFYIRPAGHEGGQRRNRPPLVKDVIPYIEKNYRVIANKDSHAITGLSMGGGHTLAALFK